jgi:hypothetical protein
LSKYDEIKARNDTHVNTIIGTGASSSASIGEIVEANLAPTLHIPKAVPAKIAGNNIALAR